MNNFATEKEKLIDSDARLIGKKSSSWPWLLGLLVLLAIAGVIWAKTNHKFMWSTQSQNNTDQTSTATTSNQTILTDFNAIYQTPNISDLSNRPVEINGLTITKVITDKMILVSSDPKNPSQLYVLLSSSAPHKIGQKFDLKGTIHNFPADPSAIKQQYALTAAQIEEFKNRLVYAEAQ